MESVGIELRAAREKKNISLGEVAAATRISHTNLERLEEGKYKDLPGGVYNRAFIRAYCEFLGLECKDILARYEEEIAPPSDKTTRAKEKRRIPSEPFIRPHPLAAWGFILIISIVGLYFSRRWIAGVFSPYFAHSPASKMAVQTPPAPTEVKPQAAAVAKAPETSIPSGPSAATTASTGQASATPRDDTGPPVPPAPQPAAAKAAAIPVTDKSAPAVPARPPGKLRIEFQVIEKCWTSVNSDGNRSVVKIMEPGEHYTFDADDRFFLILGNAGGVRLTINGKPAKSLGKSGEVSRVLINAQTVKDLIQNSPY